ncbi:MAG: hypothetical protein GYA55_05820 [SAR324 cluster bacterium]|uniref:DUF1232 domain-containing protein n=1 Tax=SAR324 cluster bacterium TaxID=2024889 RepID=A0A7X9FQX3_9DELT|nr:hypothetical protein [SAR324 cluster bacterium]
MWFFKKLRHPLPKFPQSVIPIFRNGCEVISYESFEKLSVEMDEKLNRLAEDPKRDHELQKQINSVCKLLISAYPDSDEKKKSLIVGAIRYCILNDDAISEDIFAAGYYDDVKVLNYVLEQLGIQGAFIHFGH